MSLPGPVTAAILELEAYERSLESELVATTTALGALRQLGGSVPRPGLARPTRAASRCRGSSRRRRRPDMAPSPCRCAEVSPSMTTTLRVGERRRDAEDLELVWNGAMKVPLTDGRGMGSSLAPGPDFAVLRL